MKTDKLSLNMTALFVVQDHENMNNILPVAREMVKKNIIPRIMHMDNVLHQDVADYITDNYDTSIFPLSTEKSFYLYNIFGRVFGIFKLLLTPYNEHYDYIVTGRVGILEYILIKKLKQTNPQIQVSSIQDAIIIYPESNSTWKRIRKVFYFTKNRLNICSRIYLSGEVTKQSMLQDGVVLSKLLVTGLPRLAAANFGENDKKNPVSSQKIFLFLTGAHKWNGYKKWSNFQEDTINKLEIFSESHQDMTIWIKQHPRDDLVIESNNIKVLRDKEIDMRELLLQVDFVFASVSPSTILFQASNLGKDIFFIEYEDLSKVMPSYTLFKDSVKTIEISETGELMSKIINGQLVLKKSKRLRDFLLVNNESAVRSITEDIIGTRV